VRDVHGALADDFDGKPSSGLHSLLGSGVSVLRMK